MKADVLKKLRKTKGLTQSDLAKKIGVARSAISMIESGKQEGGRELTKKISIFFGVTIDYLEGFQTDDEKKEALVSDFISFLVDNKIIQDENNIDENTEKMILDMVKREVANLKKGR